MCEFCTSHGEGRKWYLNMANYTEAVFRKVNSEERLRAYLKDFPRSVKDGPTRAERWRRRMPFVYDLIVSPFITSHMKKTHFGQIVPIEDVERIMSSFENVVRLPCVCRMATTGRERRVCYAVGMDMSHILGDVPELKDFDRVSADEAAREMRVLDRLGMMHSVWTFQTPFIGAICNCDRDCMAWRFEHRMALGRLMWRSEYAASVDRERCTGCGRCMARCYFDSITCGKGLARINYKLCYGCGICRAVCEYEAITLEPRQSVAGARGRW